MHAPIHHHELAIPQLADKQVRVEPTDDCEQLKVLCGWIEQESYKEIRPLALFGSSVVQYAMEGGASSGTLYLERVIVCSSKTQSDEVPKVPEALRSPLWHFWHPVG